MKNKNKLVYGIGICDMSSIYDNKKQKYYILWNHMMQRCYSKLSLIKRPTYIGCSVCDEWKYLSNFEKWFNDNYKYGYELDKDIMVDGNKIYSPETCCFIPQYLNSLFTDCLNNRGNYLIGCNFHKASNKYTSQISINSKKVYLGLFDNEIDAHNMWLKTKREYASKLAIDAYMNNEIDERIMNAIIKKAYNLK